MWLRVARPRAIGISFFFLAKRVDDVLVDGFHGAFVRDELHDLTITKWWIDRQREGGAHRIESGALHGLDEAIFDVGLS